MGFETYLIENMNQMNALLIKAEAKPDCEQDFLLDAAVIGCRTLKELSADDEFETRIDQLADVRLIADLFQRASGRAKRVERKRAQEFRSIIEDDTEFERFLELERQVLLMGGLDATVADLLIEASLESIESVRSRAKPPSEVQEAVRLLRDRACLLSDDLIVKAKNEERWEGIKERIKKIMLGIGGAALIGLNASSLAASVGITTAGSVVSAAIGATVMQGAAASDRVKARGAAS